MSAPVSAPDMRALGEWLAAALTAGPLTEERVREIVRETVREVQQDGPRVLLTISEAAEVLRVSPRTVYRLLDTGHLASITVGARRLVPGAEVRRYVTTHTKGGV